MSDFCLRCKVTDEIGGNWQTVENQIAAGQKVFGEFQVIDWFFDPMPDDYYGEFSQGHEGELYIVFNYETQYFKKTGTGDSYGNHSWDGPVVEVFPKEIQRVVYIYEEREN